MVRRLWRVALVCVAALGMSACVSVQLPSIAHVHVGHAITAWPETPGQRGLLEVARSEAATIVEHAGYAVAGARDMREVKLHLGHVLHALDPALEREGPGLGYGLAPALAGAVDHLGFAAEANDASANFRSGLPAVVERLRPLQRQAQVLVALSRDARGSADVAQVVTYSEEVRQRSEALRQELDAVSRQLDALLAAESPAYRPIAQRYLFGLIRLPSGGWTYAPSVQGSGYGSYR